MKRIRRDERGSSLLIALVFLSLFSLWVSSTLTSAENSLHITQTMRVEPKRLYAADGAIEQAIQRVRYDSNLGVDVLNPPSCGTTATLNDKTYYVQCEPQPGSGHSPYGGSSPSLGIIALTDGGGGEVGYTQHKNGIIKVDGGVFSNFGISFQNGSVCPGTNCQQLNLCPDNTRTVHDAAFLAANAPNTPSKFVTSFDAGFMNGANNETDVGVPISGAGIAPGARIEAANPPTITMTAKASVVGINRTITFRENYPPYNSQCHPTRTSHGQIRVVGASCSESNIVAVEWKCHASPTDPENPNEDDFVAYTPDEVDFTDQSVPTCPAGRIVTFAPGRYSDVAGLNNLTNTCNGKIFYFGPGTYNFDFSGAESPSWYLGNPTSWVLAGEKNFETSKTTSNDTGIVIGSMNKDSKTLTAGTSVFKANDIGAYVSGGIDLPGSAKITGFTSATQVTLDKAPGAKITSAVFAVTPKTVNAPCDKRPDTNHPGAEFIFSGPSRMQMGDMRFEICSPVEDNRQQNALFGARVTEGDLVAQNGCITAQPYPGAGCPMVSTEPNRSPVFIVHGTIFAPEAAIDLAVKNFSYQAVSRGIVARVVALEMFPNAVFTDPVIYSPNFGTVVGADREMLFTACENGTAGSPCPSGRPKLRAMVRFQDHDEFNNLVVGHKVKVDSWTVVR